jgi:solute carrier family 36 (proton-coupled amino acid transporter)
MIAIAIFLTYSLQFYVPMEIIWKHFKPHFSKHKDAAEYIIRIVLVIFTVMVSAAIPKLGPFITLIGAVCLSTLGLMFPAIIGEFRNAVKNKKHQKIVKKNQKH